MMMVKEAPASRNTPEWGARLEWREYMAGWSSGMLNITITFPINKTMFRSDKMPVVHRNRLNQLSGNNCMEYQFGSPFHNSELKGL